MTEEQYQVAMKELMRIEGEMHELEMKQKRLDEILQDMFNRLEMERPSDRPA